MSSLAVVTVDAAWSIGAAVVVGGVSECSATGDLLPVDRGGEQGGDGNSILCLNDGTLSKVESDDAIGDSEDGNRRPVSSSVATLASLGMKACMGKYVLLKGLWGSTCYKCM